MFYSREDVFGAAPVRRLSVRPYSIERFTSQTDLPSEDEQDEKEEDVVVAIEEMEEDFHLRPAEDTSSEADALERDLYCDVDEPRHQIEAEELTDDIETSLYDDDAGFGSKHNDKLPLTNDTEMVPDDADVNVPSLEYYSDATSCQDDADTIKGDSGKNDVASS